MPRSRPAQRTPWSFVPTLYFAEGLPYVLINNVSVILYKRLGVDNARIALWTSLLYLPWVVKMLWAPAVDLISTKRNWILVTQFGMAACLFAAALSLTTEAFFALSLLCFGVGAFISATHDVAADGFYMLALRKDDQALFAGIRTTFYRLAMIFGTGALVYAAGVLEGATGAVAESWTVVMVAPAVIFIAIAAYHQSVLPRPVSDGARQSAVRTGGAFGEVFVSYFRQERIWAIIAFILFYRFAEALMLKLVAPFLLDSVDKGGLGLTTDQVGLVYGTVGMICLIGGGILGGWIIATFGFRRSIWPLALALHLPDLVYVYMASARPPLSVVYSLVALEQFGYGLGLTAFTVFLMYSAGERYKTSHFAISTGIMALGMMVPGMISGYLQEAVGYQTFFLIVMAMTIPGLLTVVAIPKK